MFNFSYRISATDTTNATTAQTLKNILLCDCKTLSTTNQCLFSQVQTVVDSSNSLVACTCDSAYTGSFCEQKIDFCAVADLCNLYPSLNLNFTCTSLTTSLKYKCNGVCPATGFTQDIHSACIGK